MLDNGKRRAILLIGLAGMLLMPLGYMFASVIFLAFVFRMVHGASLALSNTATATIASDVIPAPRFAEGMGMFGMATALATSCAPALGLYLMDQLQLHGAFRLRFRLGAHCVDIVRYSEESADKGREKASERFGVVFACGSSGLGHRTRIHADFRRT